jgi:CxxC motif-containing protein (DUF1111 family)
VQAPASTKARDGLGPHFIARSCGGCHVKDGRGAPPDAGKGEQPVGMLLRLSVPGVGAHGGVVPEPTYGDQFNNFAVQGVKPEGKVDIAYTEVHGKFADGTPYTLLQPRYGFRDLGYGPDGEKRAGQPAHRAADHRRRPAGSHRRGRSWPTRREQAKAGGPIKGTPNRVWDAPAGKMMLGRFGWKANVATIAHQTAGAFNGDIGITSPCSRMKPAPRRRRTAWLHRGAPRARAPEIDDKTYGDVVFYQATLAPPARRMPADAQVLQAGEKLFAEAQCATCHRPSYVTKASPNPQFSSPALNGQRIHPYTDLLLHDMGEALADGRPDGQANGRQWKTPAAVGRRPDPGRQRPCRLLHDGRANGRARSGAVARRRGGSQPRQVLKMSKPEREALVKFVESL